MTVNLRDFFKFYDDTNPNHIKSIDLLSKVIPSQHLQDDSEWIRVYRTKNKDSHLITKSQLAYIWGCSETLIKDEEMIEMNRGMNLFEINNPVRIRHFLAQISHESGGGKWMKELASGVDYEGRKDLGNTQKGDGPKYKGAGYIQMTGRYNYQQFSNYIQDPKVMNGVDYVAEKYPVTSSGYWWMINKMNKLCDDGATCRQVSARVNGRDPANGLTDREKYYKRCCEIIK